jgi:hypothetical protein
VEPVIPVSLSLGGQVVWLLILALPIACVAWTVTHEEVFREPREYCIRQSKDSRWLLTRKVFYMLTCEYCFSHYITIFFLFVSEFQLLIEGWRGYLIAGFALVWLANAYMSLYAFLRIDLKKERLEASMEERKFVRMRERRPRTPAGNGSTRR